MSWSLKLTHGDFELSNASLGTVTAENKLVQDFRCYLLERMGTDNLHPGFGSLIDGGIQPDGTEVESPIGESDVQTVVLFLEKEIRRIGSDYQQRQLARAKSDKFTYSKVTLTAGEILVGIPSVTFTQTMDTLDVVVALQTGNNTQRSLTIPVPNTLLL